MYDYRLRKSTIGMERINRKKNCQRSDVNSVAKYMSFIFINVPIYLYLNIRLCAGHAYIALLCVI